MIDEFDYSQCRKQLLVQGLSRLEEVLDSMLVSGFDVQRYGDFPRWREAVAQLPALKVERVVLDQPQVSVLGDAEKAVREVLEAQLRQLMPWRKGPFSLFGVDIDTEWRSDMKWDRLAHAITPLAGRRVLDVGCGSGYHCWRMAAEGASLVLLSLIHI